MPQTQDAFSTLERPYTFTTLPRQARARIGLVQLASDYTQEEMERRFSLPMVSSNQALIWHALQLAGQQSEIAGFGRLLRTPSTEVMP